MNRVFLTIFLMLISFSCKNENIAKKPIQIDIDLNDYILYPQYSIKDARSFGLFVDSINYKVNPNTKKTLINSLIEYCSLTGEEVSFERGDYNIDIPIVSRSNIRLNFNNSVFNQVYIGGDSIVNKNISLEGVLHLKKGFAIYNTENLKVDSLFIGEYTNVESKGCHIYKKTKNISFNFIKVNKLSSGSESLLNNHAALALDGLRNPPQNVFIDHIQIESSDRHGIFITGENHKINRIEINKYAVGSTKYMSGMQGTSQGEELILSGMWINRCNNCEFGNVKIHTKNSNNAIPLKLDEGVYDQPTIIKSLSLDVDYKDELVLDDVLTNCLVKEIKRID